MKNEENKANKIVIEKNKSKESLKDPYATSAYIGGFIGMIVGYNIKRAGLLVFGFWEGSLFVGGAAAAGSAIAMSGCYIFKQILKRFNK